MYMLIQKMYMYFQKIRSFLLPPARPPAPFFRAKLTRTKQLIDCGLISTFRVGLKEILKELENMFEKDDLCERIRLELQKTIWMDKETIIRKVLSGLIQSD